MSCILSPTIQNSEIRCEFTVKSSQDRVWTALTTHEGWSAWFSEDIDTDFQPGSVMRMDFGTMGECWGVVAERVEKKVFAFRWHPSGGGLGEYPDGEMTTVRFELFELEGATRIVLTESGFENLPEDRRKKFFDLNTEGWNDELGEMAVWLEDETSQKTTGSVIRRDRTYKTTPEKLWQAVATVEGLSSWFCKEVVGDLSPGEIAILIFDYGKRFEGPIKVIKSSPITEFSFRWHPGQVDGCKWEDFPESEATEVVFTIAPCAEGAHLTVVESGFNHVPNSRLSTVLGMNRGGWTAVMEMIASHLETH